MPVNLIDLEPSWSRPDRTAFKFTCPSCKYWHRIGVNVSAPPLYHNGYIWKMTGSTFEDMTIQPSINCDAPEDILGEDGKVTGTVPSGCKFHGWITNGMVTW